MTCLSVGNRGLVMVLPSRVVSLKALEIAEDVVGLMSGKDAWLAAE